MSMYMQQLNTRSNQVSQTADAIVRAVSLKANILLLLVLVLIPTLNGVALIA